MNTIQKCGWKNITETTDTPERRALKYSENMPRGVWDGSLGCKKAIWDYFCLFLNLKQKLSFANILNALSDSDIVTWSIMERMACQVKYTKESEGFYNNRRLKIVSYLFVLFHCITTHSCLVELC